MVSGEQPVLRRGYLIAEILLVLGLSLGRAGVFSVVDFIADVTSGVPLADQTTTLNPSASPRPLLDLTLQLLRIGFALVIVGLVAYLLQRSGESLRVIGVDASQPGRDLGRGAALAALIGGTGLIWYLIAYNAGINLNVAAQGLPDEWWRTPVLVLGAVENAVLEEVVVLGFVLHRLRQLDWSWTSAIATSAVIRGSYHLYQGIGGFVGNLVMGLVFGWLFKRWGRVMPMIVAHALIDTVAFIGYALLAGKVSWLPG
ncbi:MAG: CPBP family intramembrane metalloprotease [Lysobacterales bacterium]|nr:MAG: CPBP family intramembrane metalloprotease [Xanthomonadales bacterium]